MPFLTFCRCESYAGAYAGAKLGIAQMGDVGVVIFQRGAKEGLLYLTGCESDTMIVMVRSLPFISRALPGQRSPGFSLEVKS